MGVYRFRTRFRDLHENGMVLQRDTEQLFWVLLDLMRPPEVYRDGMQNSSGGLEEVDENGAPTFRIPTYAERILSEVFFDPKYGKFTSVDVGRWMTFRLRVKLPHPTVEQEKAAQVAKRFEELVRTLKEFNLHTDESSLNRRIEEIPPQEDQLALNLLNEKSCMLNFESKYALFCLFSNKIFSLHRLSKDLLDELTDVDRRYNEPLSAIALKRLLAVAMAPGAAQTFRFENPRDFIIPYLKKVEAMHAARKSSGAKASITSATTLEAMDIADAFHEPSTARVDLMTVRKILITPTRMIGLAPTPELANSVLRQYKVQLDFSKFFPSLSCSRNHLLIFFFSPCLFSFERAECQRSVHSSWIL
jgi:hypothetical protein